MQHITATTVATPSPPGHAHGLVVSADPLAGQGLARLLERSGWIADTSIVPTVEQASATAPLVAVVNLRGLPDPSVHTLRCFADRVAPRVLCVMLDDRPTLPAIELVAAGVDGLLRGDETPEAVRLLLETAASRARRLASSCERVGVVLCASATHHGRVAHSGVLGGLTPKQREVARLIAAGYSNADIARQLRVTEGTVKVHVTAVLKELGVRSRLQAAVAIQAARSP